MSKLPTTSELKPAVIIALNELGGRAHFKEIENTVAINLAVSPSDLQIIHNGKRTEFSYRMSWARASAKSQNLIQNEGKGIWSKV